MVQSLSNSYIMAALNQSSLLMFGELCVGLLIVALVGYILFRRKQRNEEKQLALPITENSAVPSLLSTAEPTRQFALLHTPFTIGSAPGNDLIIDNSFANHKSVSPTHARIVQQEIEQEQQYLIEDLNSYRGIRINQQWTPKNLLRSGTKIMIGEVEFIFQQGEY